MKKLNILLVNAFLLMCVSSCNNKSNVIVDCFLYENNGTLLQENVVNQYQQYQVEISIVENGQNKTYDLLNLKPTFDKQVEIATNKIHFMEQGITNITYYYKNNNYKVSIEVENPKFGDTTKKYTIVNPVELGQSVFINSDENYDVNFAKANALNTKLLDKYTYKASSSNSSTHLGIDHFGLSVKQGKDNIFQYTNITNYNSIYSSEFSDDLTKLSNQEITPQDIYNKYGTHIVCNASLQAIFYVEYTPVDWLSNQDKNNALIDCKSLNYFDERDGNIFNLIQANLKVDILTTCDKERIEEVGLKTYFDTVFADEINYQMTSNQNTNLYEFIKNDNIKQQLKDYYFENYI